MIPGARTTARAIMRHLLDNCGAALSFPEDVELSVAEIIHRDGIGPYMESLGRIGLLAEAARYVPGELRDRIEQAMEDACKHGRLTWRWVSDELVVEPTGLCDDTQFGDRVPEPPPVPDGTYEHGRLTWRGVSDELVVEPTELCDDTQFGDRVPEPPPVPDGTYERLDKAAENFKKGIASEPVDLDKYDA